MTYAAARQAWLESDEARMLSNTIEGAISGDALRNRLEAAFCAGYVHSLADQAATPAPMAGDAVSALPRSWRKEAGIQQNHSYARGLDRCAEQLTAALAQDRASQVPR